MRGLSATTVLALAVIAAPGKARAASEPIPTRQRPLVAAHPLTVNDGSPADKVELQRFWDDLLNKVLKVRRVEAEPLQAALQGEQRGQCESADADCLGRLAKATGADRALLLTVNLFPVLVNGVVTDARGNLIAPPRTIVAERGELRKGRLRAAKRGIDQVVRALVQAPAEPISPTSNANESVVPQALAPSQDAPFIAPEPPQPAAIVVPRDEPAPSRGSGKVLGYAMCGVGVASLAGGGWFFVQANDSKRRFDRLADSDPERGLTTQQELLRLSQDTAARRTWSAGLLGAGAAAAAIGAVLVWSGGQTKQASVTWSIGPSGAAVAGVFP